MIVALLPLLVILKSPPAVKSDVKVSCVLLAMVILSLPVYEVLAPVGHKGPELCVQVNALKLDVVPVDIPAVQSGELNTHCAGEDSATAKNRPALRRQLRDFRFNRLFTIYKCAKMRVPDSG